MAASPLCPSRSRTCHGQQQIRSPGKGSCCRRPGEGSRFPKHSAPAWGESLRRICCHASLLHPHCEPEAVNRTGFQFLCDSWTHPPALSVIHNSPPATGNDSVNGQAKNIKHYRRAVLIYCIKDYKSVFIIFVIKNYAHNKHMNSLTAK